MRETFFAFLLAAAQTVTPPTSVKLSWNVFPLSRRTNPGWYNVWRAAKSGDYCAGSLGWIGHLEQTYDAAGNPVAPTFVDSHPLPLACYSVSFIQTLSGTTTAVESEQSAPISVAFPGVTP